MTFPFHFCGGTQNNFFSLRLFVEFVTTKAIEKNRYRTLALSINAKMIGSVHAYFHISMQIIFCEAYGITTSRHGNAFGITEPLWWNPLVTGQVDSLHKMVCNADV